MTTIVTYETQVADLLHDATHVIWTTTQLDRYINEARRQIAMDTMCLRTLQTIYCTAGVEAYPYGSVTGASITNGGTGYASAPAVGFTGGGGGSGVAATASVSGGAVTSLSFTSFGSGYTSAPTISFTGGGGSGAAATAGIVSDNTLDILQVNCIWGAMRYPLNWRPWSVFSTLVRQYTTLQDQPSFWSFYGPRQIYIGPLPNQVYQMELDSCILPTDLSGSTADPLPLQVQDPIKFFAAYLAKYYAQQFGESESFRAQYGKRLNECLTAYNRRVPNPVESAA